MALFLVCTLIAFVLIFMYVTISKVLNFFHRPKKVTLSTPVTEFKESYGTDSTIIKGAIKSSDSISALYEEMCVRNPLKYKNDPRVDSLLASYRKLIKGELPDITGKHIPSEYIDGKINPDYKKYLHNQRLVLKRNSVEAPWVDKFCKEFTTLEKYRKAKDVFEKELQEAGLPFLTVQHLLTDERMASTTQEEWKAIKLQVERYLGDFESIYVNEFIDYASDMESLCDYDVMEAFATWMENDVPSQLAYLCASGTISEEDMHEIIRLRNAGLDIKEATRKILKKVVTAAEEDDLRDMYKKSVR
jgi:hypothetical protein